MIRKQKLAVDCGGGMGSDSDDEMKDRQGGSSDWDKACAMRGQHLPVTAL